MSTYEPGTVAVATVRGVPNIDVMFVLAGAQASPRWVSPAPIGGGWIHRLDQVEDVERIVTLRGLRPGRLVCDLRDLADEAHGNFAWRDAFRKLRTLADEIEAQTKPPKPPEPTGLGAVIEDANGERWVLRSTKATLDRFECAGTYRNYDDINAVRVLSDGVQP